MVLLFLTFVKGLHKSCKCYSIIFQNRTPKVDWDVVRWGLKNKHHIGTCLKEVGLCLHVLLTSPQSIVNTIGRTYVFGWRIENHGCKHSKVDQKSIVVYESHDFLGQTPISSSKMFYKIYLFSWWPLLLSLVLKYRISIWDLQNLSCKVMRKSNWLYLVFNVNFMTLNIWTWIYILFLDFIIKLRSS